jgi:hypothetical protein
MLVGWEGKKLSGGGNPTNGGDPSDALVAMTESKGVGIAHESIWPYSDRRGDLGRNPSEAVLSDAKACHLSAPIVVDTLDEGKSLIDANHPFAIGTWWPSAWGDSGPFFFDYGRGSYGHSVLVSGHVEAGTFPGREGKYAWWEIENSWNMIYDPLPAPYAAALPGYRPSSLTKGSSFFVEDGCFRKLAQKSGWIAVSATDIDGIKDKIVVPSFGIVMPV